MLGLKLDRLTGYTCLCAHTTYTHTTPAKMGEKSLDKVCMCVCMHASMCLEEPEAIPSVLICFLSYPKSHKNKHTP